MIGPDRMRLAKLLAYFETSPALRLLRSTNAPFILDFLDRQFKGPGRISIPHSDLHPALIEYQDELRESHPGALPMRAETYLAEWCAPDALWLRRFLEAGRDEPVYQLTPHTEDVFGFLDRVLDEDLGFVGTESRLKLVVETLADLVVGASDDPDSRLAHLRGRRPGSGPSPRHVFAGAADRGGRTSAVPSESIARVRRVSIGRPSSRRWMRVGRPALASAHVRLACDWSIVEIP
jgi:hypothetical protein